MLREKFMLVVDDAELNRAILENIFASEFHVLQAENGKTAMEIMKRQKIDILLLDIIMPEMDGFEVLQEMKCDPKLEVIPVIVSTSDKNEAEEKALILGADDFISKPYQPVVVRKRVENIMVKNILEKERLQNALWETRTELNSLMDSVPGGISIWKVTDKIQVQYFNDGFCNQFGYSRDEFQRDCCEDLSPYWVEDKGESLLQTLMKKGKAGERFNIIRKIIRKDGTIRWISMNAVRYKEEEGNPVFRIVDIDMTESKENELLIEQQNRELCYLLERDSLTGLYNRATFCKKTSGYLEKHQNEKFAVVQFDIERFKVINEFYGNQVGDKILRIIAKELKESITGSGIYGRLEADHFAVCMSSDMDGIKSLSESLDKRLATLEIEQKVMLYYGIYYVEDIYMPADLMCDRANLALRTVKGNSNQIYAIYNEGLQKIILSEQQLTNSMHEALNQRQFEVYYQPVVDLNDKKLVSAEALVRWNHPEKGLVSPGLFVPFFEHNGFIIKLDAYIREEVCRHLSELKEKGIEQVPVSVNISRLEFYDPNLCSSIVELTEKYQIEPRLLRLEITESAYNDNPKQLLAAMKELQSKGFRVLMDDFGSGYSSLNMLKDVPVDILKMDMQFLEDQGINGRGLGILASVVRMSRDLQMQTIAEGIETETQAQFLQSVGCEYGQGYYYARPMPKENFFTLLETEKNGNPD